MNKLTNVNYNCNNTGPFLFISRSKFFRFTQGRKIGSVEIKFQTSQIDWLKMT